MNRVDQRMAALDVRGPQRAVRAVVFARAAHVVLEAAEPRQHVGERPARVAKRGPRVVVLALTADGDQSVDRRRAAERAAARPVHLASVHPRIGLRVKPPVEDRVEHRLRVADGDVDPRIAVARTGLEQQHRMPAPGREPVGEHASRGAGADDDVVVGGPCFHIIDFIVKYSQTVPAEAARDVFDRRVRKLLHSRVSTEGFPSGQREQTVNLPALPSKVRILPPPPFRYQGSGIKDQRRQRYRWRRMSVVLIPDPRFLIPDPRV